MKKLYILTSLIAISNLTNAQTNQELVATSGDHFTNGNIQLSWSIGEVVIETVSNSTNTLTQGFHQTNLSIVGIENFTLNIEMDVYPNPTQDILTIKIPNYLNTKYELYDLNGKLLSQNQINGELTNVNLNNLSTGNYLLKVSEILTKETKTFKIIKH